MPCFTRWRTTPGARCLAGPSYDSLLTVTLCEAPDGGTVLTPG
jgi:hypothetical protein